MKIIKRREDLRLSNAKMRADTRISTHSSLYLRLDGNLLHEIKVLILWRRWPSYSLEIWGMVIITIREDGNPSFPSARPHSRHAILDTVAHR